MKLYSLLLLCLITLNAQAQDSASIKVNLQSKYLVKELLNYYVGYKNADIKKIDKEVRPLLAKPACNIKNIDCQITDENEIYEFIIEYKPKYNLKKMMVEKYGKPNNEKHPSEWRFGLADGTVLRIWQFKNKLCICNENQLSDFIYKE